MADIQAELWKLFTYAKKQHENARMAEDDTNTLYWQGRKDAIRIMQVVLPGGNKTKDSVSYVLATENGYGYKSPEWEND